MAAKLKQVWVEQETQDKAKAVAAKESRPIFVIMRESLALYIKAKKGTK